MQASVIDLERQFLIGQLGVSGVNKTIDDLRHDFYSGIADGSVSIGSGSPSALLTTNTSQLVANTGSVAINWNVEVSDPDNMHDPANPSRVVIPPNKSGLYLINAQLEWESNATGLRSTLIAINGVIKNDMTIPTVGTGDSTRVQNTIMQRLNATDYIQILTWQNSGISLNVVGSTSTFLNVVRLGA